MSRQRQVMPAQYDGLEVEYARLRGDRGLVDWRGSGFVELSGSGALDLLDELCTRSAAFLLEERTLAALMLRENGSLIGEVLISCHGDSYTVEVHPAQRDAVWAHLSAHAAGREDVALADLSDQVAIFGVEGPRAQLSVQPFLDMAIGEIAYKSFTTAQWQGRPLVISRTGVTAEFGYRLRVAAEHGDELHARLVELGALPCGGDALDVCRLESRFANLEWDCPAADASPFEVALQWMVDFDRDFLGREALLRRWESGVVRHPVCFVAGEDTAVRRGDRVLADGEVVGQVTHVRRSPGVGALIGLAHLDAELAAAGLDLLACGDHGDTGIRTCSAPFLVPRSIEDLRGG